MARKNKLEERRVKKKQLDIHIQIEMILQQSRITIGKAKIMLYSYPEKIPSRIYMN